MLTVRAYTRRSIIVVLGREDVGVGIRIHVSIAVSVCFIILIYRLAAEHGIALRGSNVNILSPSGAEEVRYFTRSKGFGCFIF